jgi:hypothetical protein
MFMKHFVLIIMLFAVQTIYARRVLTYEQAVSIALNESYTIRSYAEELKAMEFSYLYYKAQFKPRLDLNVFTPQWSENVTAVERPDGLPVYNSVGNMKFGADLGFTYVLPTGGNLSLNSVIYHQQISTSLAEQDYLSLKRKQAFNQFGIMFNQPLFTKNKLKEDLITAETPIGWIVRVSPQLIRSLDSEQEQKAQIVIVPPKSGVGAQEVKIKTEALADNRKVDTEDKTVRIQVNAKTSVWGTIALVLLLIGLLVGIVILGIKLSKR